jgi:hypothetical protein
MEKDSDAQKVSVASLSFSIVETLCWNILLKLKLTLFLSLPALNKLSDSDDYFKIGMIYMH